MHTSTGTIIKKEIYLKVIDRIISYGHEIWYQDRVKQNLKLSKLQRSGLICITKCYRTVATDTLQVLAGIPPIDIKTALNKRLFHLKYEHKELHVQDMTIQPQELVFKKTLVPPWTKVSIPWNHYNMSLEGTLIFTDGSKMDNQVGGAFVVYYNNQEIHHSCFRLSNHASVYLAELTAISTALDYVADNNITQANIISDARSVLLALENPNNFEPHTVALKNKLINISGKIQLYWIKAHFGFAGNEKADEYAKQATTKQTIDISTSINIHVVKNMLKRELMVNWQHRWESSTKGRSVYTLFPKVSTKRVQGDFFLNQLITGHGTIAIYQQRFFGKTANCQCGHPMEDIHHIIYVCPLWDSIRKKFFPRNFQSVKLELLLFNNISKLA
ncbi:uncharacterized protein CDAR_77401 [Caerostris darwini]|uniref:ribonuclease H n=1 Tax=Caerostris darwini TaxID=1538125 RepID=A0AAV4N7Y0_9ARAC|nr:uncharacterized protein CDAR_77401 [Caerostris darwini]